MPNRSTIAAALTQLVLLLAGEILLAQGQPGRVYIDESVAAESAAIGARRPYRHAPAPLRIELPPLTVAEEASVATPRLGTPLQVGIHRSMPEAWAKRLSPSELVWESLADGSQVTALSVRSPGARAVRVAIEFETLPPNAEVRYYAPETPDSAFGPYRRDLVGAHRDGAGDGEPFWSPLIAGEVIVVEIFVPVADSTAEVWISLAEVAHLVESPFEADFLKDVGDAGRCNKDLACTKKWERTGASVALVIFEQRGGVFSCTGQLINQTGFDGSRFLFLTARHCIAKNKVARSAIFLWFYQRARCRGNAPDSLVQTAGGAKVKYASPVVGRKRSTDHSLLELRRDPPSGVTLSGWDASHFSNHLDKKVKGIHHPSADFKKLSQGKILDTGVVEGDFIVFDPFAVSHYVVRWKKGVVEEGSSGSGLWVGRSWPDQRLVGVLTGGRSSCQARRDIDVYGMLSETYRRSAKFRRWIDSQQ